MHVVPRIMRQPEAFLDPHNAPKSLAAGALPQTPLGELTALPRPPSWIQGVLLLRGGEGMGREGQRRGGEERAGEGLPRLEITSGYALGCGGRGWAAAQKITFVSKMITLSVF